MDEAASLLLDRPTGGIGEGKAERTSNKLIGCALHIHHDLYTSLVHG